ncbi:MAG: lysophospholipase [Proteobacteria bacterium]|nr:lysophospholipase [Pseudomonadota bacterium]
MEHRTGSLIHGPNEELFWQAWRPESKPRGVVVLVHGYGEHSGRYPHVVETLVPEGFSVWAADNRGHGRSFGIRGHVDQWGDFRTDLRHFLSLVGEQEPGIPLFLFGHSMGGLIVLDYVLHHPQGLAGVAVSGPALDQGAVNPLLILASRVLSRVAPRLAVKSGLDDEAVSRDPRVVADYRNDPLVHGMATGRLGTEMARTMKWVLAHAPEFSPPLFIIHGGADRLVAPETSAEFYHRVTLTDKQRNEYLGYFHETHNDTGWEKPVGDLAAWFSAHLPKAEK